VILYKITRPSGFSVGHRKYPTRCSRPLYRMCLRSCSNRYLLIRTFISKMNRLITSIELVSASAASCAPYMFRVVFPHILSSTTVALQLLGGRLWSTVGLLLQSAFWATLLRSTDTAEPHFQLLYILACSTKTGNSLILKGTRNRHNSCFKPPSNFLHLHSSVMARE